MRSIPPIAAAALFFAPAAAQANPVMGKWLLQNRKAVVTVGSCGPALCGRVTEVRKYPKDGARTDIHNRDASLRDRPLLGLLVLSGLAPQDGGWQGRVYDPKSGRTFSGTVTPAGDTLSVKACILFVCKTQLWTRVR